MQNKNNEVIEIAHGGGGKKTSELIQEIRQILNWTGKWKNCEDDAAVFNLPPGSRSPRLGNNLLFTTDAFIVDPIFFPGGDIGKIAICGTINDLSVMGAKPLGISLSMVIEEGFLKNDLMRIIKSISEISKMAGVPVVTGDTKVMERGKIDKIEITTAGVGLADKITENKGVKAGDYIIASGDLGEHGASLLALRFGFKTKIKSDCKPLNKELAAVGKYLNSCKDPTRGGLAANLTEMAEKSKVKIVLDESALPYKKEVVSLSELLGIDIFSLPSEGRFIAAVSPNNVEKVLKILNKFNSPITGKAKILGRAETAKNNKIGLPAEALAKAGVFLQIKTGGTRKIENPTGKLIPRIC